MWPRLSGHPGPAVQRVAAALARPVERNGSRVHVEVTGEHLAQLEVGRNVAPLVQLPSQPPGPVELPAVEDA